MISPDLCYCFPFQQCFHALNVLYPRCVTFWRTKVNKPNSPQTEWPPHLLLQPRNKMPSAPPSCSSLLKIQLIDGEDCVVLFHFFFAFHIANVHTSLMTVEFENIFLVSLQLLAGFFCYYFYRICLVSVCPNELVGNRFLLEKKRLKPFPPQLLS